MTNERIAITTNKILVGAELQEEYVFDENKKIELEVALKNLIKELCEMIDDEDEGLTIICDDYGKTVSLDTDTVYDMIDDMYLSLSWVAPRWGSATDRTSKCFAYERERVILAYEIALKLGGYTDSVLFNLGTNDVKRINFEDWYASTDSKKDLVYATIHEFIYADSIYIPFGPVEVDDVYILGN